MFLQKKKQKIKPWFAVRRVRPKPNFFCNFLNTKLNFRFCTLGRCSSKISEQNLSEVDSKRTFTLLPLLLLCDRARFCQNILTSGRCFYKKINRERRSIRVKHQNSEQNFCKFFCFCEIVFAKSYHFVKKIFRNYKKNFCKKTPPQGTKSGKSERKNIETVNSRIDGLFFVFIFVKTPPQGPK